MVPVEGGKLWLAITDDGKGFAMKTTGKSLGSRLIKTSSLQMGGVSSIQSVPRQGTVVGLVFPDPDLKPEAPAA